MSRNQNRIEGEYAIVSAFRAKRSLLQNHLATNRAVAFAQEQGVEVALLTGYWNGTVEISLKLSGLGFAGVAQDIAQMYYQDAYIVVLAGKATLYSIHGVAGDVFDAEYEGLDENGNGSEHATGHQFHFGVA